MKSTSLGEQVRALGAMITTESNELDKSAISTRFYKHCHKDDHCA